MFAVSSVAPSHHTNTPFSHHHQLSVHCYAAGRDMALPPFPCWLFVSLGFYCVCHVCCRPLVSDTNDNAYVCTTNTPNAGWWWLVWSFDRDFGSVFTVFYYSYRCHQGQWPTLWACWVTLLTPGWPRAEQRPPEGAVPHIHPPEGAEDERVTPVPTQTHPHPRAQCHMAPAEGCRRKLADNSAMSLVEGTVWVYVTSLLMIMSFGKRRQLPTQYQR